MDEQKLESLLEKLETSGNWPQVYMFKFIFKSEHRIMALIESWFDSSAKISHASSANNKYTSITVEVTMQSASDVVEIYRYGSAVDGLIML